MILPIVSHVYSLGLLLEAGRWSEISSESKQRYVRTMILDVVAIVGIGTALCVFYRLF